MSITRRVFNSTPQQSEESAGINSQAFNVTLDGTSGNGAVGTTRLTTIFEAGTTIYEAVIIGAALTPDTATPTIKLNLTTDGDITATETAEDINDAGILTMQTTPVETTVNAQPLNLIIAGAAISGTFTIIIKYLIPTS